MISNNFVLTHIVVVNHEQQYSVWANNLPLPKGWEPVTIPGPWIESYRSRHPGLDDKETCLAYIGEIWQDMRPLSLRRFQQAQNY